MYLLLLVGPKPAPIDEFIFGYHFGDVLSMHLAIYKKNVEVFAEVYLLYTSGKFSYSKDVYKQLRHPY